MTTPNPTSSETVHDRPVYEGIIEARILNPTPSHDWLEAIIIRDSAGLPLRTRDTDAFLVQGDDSPLFPTWERARDYATDLSRHHHLSKDDVRLDIYSVQGGNAALILKLPAYNRTHSPPPRREPSRAGRE